MIDLYEGAPFFNHCSRVGFLSKALVVKSAEGGKAFPIRADTACGRSEGCYSFGFTLRTSA